MIFKEIEIDGRIFKVYKTGEIVSPRGISLKPQDSGKGYKYVALGKGRNPKKKNYYIHILVAKLFVNNPDNLPEVNHKDSNRANNHYKNLEWVTRLENIHDYMRKGRGNWPARKPVYQYDMNGVFIKEWDSPQTAAKYYNCTDELIQQAASPNNKNCITAKGFKWMYKQFDGEYPLKTRFKPGPKSKQAKP
jgi:hypothetical protein